MPSAFSEPRAAYIHVPFCRHRCGYCDFTLVARKDHLIAEYLQALELELQSCNRPLGSRFKAIENKGDGACSRELAPKTSVPGDASLTPGHPELNHETASEIETLFFGGGTPTHLSVEQLSQLFEMVLKKFELSEDYEFSVEANPSDLTDEKIDLLADVGVNRVSLGLQSFDASVLTTLERDHREDDIVAVIQRLSRRFNNVSFDLIFGVPGQTLQLWRETLQQAIHLEPAHISTYGLTFEKGTSFWSRREKGELVQLDDERERAMYAAAIDDLAAAGFAQYEISNFARPGFACRHNEVYWKGLPYFGFGPGAARYINGRREINHRSVTTWIKRVLAGESPVGESEQLSDEDRARELIAIGLRRTVGIDRDEFQETTGFNLDDLVGEAISRLQDIGHLEETGTHLRLTREGHFLADSVVAEFL